MNLKSKLFFWIRLTFGIGLLSLLLYKSNIKSIYDNLINLNILYIVFALFIAAIGIYIRAYKWKKLLDLQGAYISINKAHIWLYISIFFNNFFLGTLGGDSYRVLKTIDHADKKTGAISTVLMDRLTGLVALVIIVFIGIISSLFIPSSLIEKEIVLKLVIFCLSAFIAFYFLYKILLILNKRNPSNDPSPNRLTKVFFDLVETVHLHFEQPKPLLVSLLMSILYQLTTIISMYFYTLSTGHTINLFDLAVIVPLVSFLIMIPVSVNGIGIQEGIFFYFFDKTGLPPSISLLIALLPRAGMILISIIGGLLYIYEKRYFSKPQKNSE